jgi:hypothetical protein
MTYQNDPNINRPVNRGISRDNNSYTGWIIGGVVAVAVILGIFTMIGRNSTSDTATNTKLNRPQATVPVTPAPAPAPSTTGSAAPAAR